MSVSFSSSRPLLLEDRDGGWEAFNSDFGAGLGACSVGVSLSLVGANPLAACAYEKAGIAVFEGADNRLMGKFCGYRRANPPSTLTLVQNTTQLKAGYCLVVPNSQSAATL